MKAERIFREVKPKARPYTEPDERGLGLLVQPNGSKLWRYRYRFGGVAKMISFGPYPEVSLATARAQRDKARELLRGGKNPSEVRKEEKAFAKEAHVNSFEAVALEWHAKKKDEGLNATQLAWTLRRLEVNIFPRFGAFAISEIKPPLVLTAIRAIEARGKEETAHRTLSICSQIFRYGVQTGRLESDPTRDLQGALKKVQGGHFAALTNPLDVAGMLCKIDNYVGYPVTKNAMLLGMLTFVRPGNLQTAEWSEVHELDDPQLAEWKIPSTKMKMRKDFVVPLAPQAIALLKELRLLTSQSQYIFPSVISNQKHMSNGTVLKAIRSMGYTSEQMTGHGFRAMARTLCDEVLHFPQAVIEEQLSHGKKGPLRDAYDRTTYLPERRRLMQAWADYLDTLKQGKTTTGTDRIKKCGSLKK